MQQNLKAERKMIMTVTVTFKKSRSDKIRLAVFTMLEGENLGPAAAALDKENGGIISGALAQSPKFKARNGEILELFLPGRGGATLRVMLLGLGRVEKLDSLRAETAGGRLFPALSKIGAAEASLVVEETKSLKDIDLGLLAASLANGVCLRSYSFERYKSKKPALKASKKETPDPVVDFDKIEVVCSQSTPAKKTFERLDCVTRGVFTARDLVNTPPNDLYPESFAKFIKEELRPLGVEVEILDEKKMQKMGMGAILAVGMGSVRPPRMVIMRWPGAEVPKTGKKNPAGPLAFVGKGVTFDTGGISLKPGAGMEEMKMDMGGAAAVVGLMKSLALRQSPACVVGVVGLAENMPSGNAYRPADILQSYAGKTIEVLNTDAEGRLVLADCLTYVQKTYAPRFVIDLATLTGAIMVALGHEYCGTFANDEALWGQLAAASAATGEKLWRMPLDEAWRKDMESPVADVQNLAKSGRLAGCCTAAGFLEHFIEEGLVWAHMDIAGTAWRKSDQPTVPKFGSGFGVRVLDRLVSDFYEQ
ncbi:MAG: leucyl aminopeptidase [Alphaproteobacteria bacterium]|nr:leucyl aminopeptidase [Alphaproteobacteria bacterium]